MIALPYTVWHFLKVGELIGLLEISVRLRPLLVAGTCVNTRYITAAGDAVLWGVVSKAKYELAPSATPTVPGQDGRVGAELDEVRGASGTYLQQFMRLRSKAESMPANVMAQVQAKVRLALVGEPQQQTLLADSESLEAVFWSLYRDLLARTAGVA